MFRNTKFYLPAAGLFSRSRLLGTQGSHLYPTVQVWVPAGLRDACSGRSKSPNPASNHGIAFRPARANQAHANPKNVISSFFTSLCCCYSKSHSSRQRLGSHGTAAALQSFAFVTATNGASACGFVRVRVCARVCHCRIQQQQEPGAVSRIEVPLRFFLVFFISATSTYVCCLLPLCAWITP